MEEKQEQVTKLIANIRQEIQTDNFASLQSLVEELKTAMKDMVSAEAAAGNSSSSDPMSNLNDL
jgi:hypothetical protein